MVDHSMARERTLKAFKEAFKLHLKIDSQNEKLYFAAVNKKTPFMIDIYQEYHMYLKLEKATVGQYDSCLRSRSSETQGLPERCTYPG
jgi:hypothetical protein